MRVEGARGRGRRARGHRRGVARTGRRELARVLLRRRLRPVREVRGRGITPLPRALVRLGGMVPLRLRLLPPSILSPVAIVVRLLLLRAGVSRLDRVIARPARSPSRSPTSATLAPAVRLLPRVAAPTDDALALPLPRLVVLLVRRVGRIQRARPRGRQRRRVAVLWVRRRIAPVLLGVRYPGLGRGGSRSTKDVDEGVVSLVTNAVVHRSEYPVVWSSS